MLILALCVCMCTYVHVFLQVVYSEGGENMEGSVMKLKIPVAEVLSYSLFSATSTPSYEVTDYG